MIKNWKPLLDRVLVKQDPAPTIDPNPPHLEIPENQREKYRPHTGIIVAVGPGMYQNGTFCPVALKEKQHVMFAHPDTLTRVEHAGSEHLMMREQDVFLVLDDGSKQLKIPTLWETDFSVGLASVIKIYSDLNYSKATLADLAQIPLGTMRKWRNFGPKKERELSIILAPHGLKLA